MAQQNTPQYSVGKDPRTLADFIAIKEELNKLYHPARPDVDWQYAQTLCLTLFNQNGVDLQSAAWYTQIRVQQAELSGLYQGLAIIDELVTHHWSTFWPHQTHVRVDILAQLGQQVMNSLRGVTAVYTDLPLLYQIEAQLNQICLTLQKLELKHLSQFERISTFIQNTARRLENLDNSDSPVVTSGPLFELTKEVSDEEKKQANFHIYQAPKTTEITKPATPKGNSIKYSHSASESSAATTAPVKSYKQGFLTGSASGILIAAALFFGWNQFYATATNISPLAQSLPSIPLFSDSTEQIINQSIFKQSGTNSNKIPEIEIAYFDELQTTLNTLMQLSPIWSQQYGDQLVAYLEKRGEQSPEIQKLVQEWRISRDINATSAEELEQWTQGMAQLSSLSVRLDQLDGKPKSYITGSELKSIIYTARQHFNAAIPLEEQLRLLEEAQKQGNVSASQYQQIDNHIKQLLNRYALIRQNNNNLNTLVN